MLPIAIKCLIGFHFAIGAIFDHSSQDMREAFSYEITKYNGEPKSKIKLDANSQKIQVNDSYSLSTTSKCN